MTRSLPPRPSLHHLQQEAKNLLKTHKQGNASCCDVLRRLKQFKGKRDEDVLAGHVSLVEVQYALAMAYGFDSWEKLRRAVAEASRPATNRGATALDIELRGNPCAMDSFSIVMAVVAERMGRSVGRDQIAVLSTNPFAPSIRTDEGCTSWWHIQAADRCMDLVSGRIGFGFRRMPPVDHSQDPPYPQAEAEVSRWLKDCYCRPYVRPIAEALAAGDVVVTPREWDWSKGNAWYGWGIIVEAREDGTILGACLNGRQDNALRSAGQAVILSPADATLGEVDADIRTLDRALHRIRGDAEPFLPAGNVLFGTAAMDAWIEQMRSTRGFCAECFERAPDRSWTDAHDNGALTRDGALQVSAYLRRRLGQFSAASRVHVESVAARYDRIATLLAPAVKGEGGAHYRDFIGDLDKQKEHARTVLMPVREELSAAADDIEKALTASRRADAGQDQEGGRR